MSVEISTILNGETAGDIRAKLNTNFSNLAEAVDDIDLSNVSKIILTSSWTTEFETEPTENTLQIAIASGYVKSGIYSNSSWSVIGEYVPASQQETPQSVVIVDGDNGVGFEVPLAQQDSTLEASFVGYNSSHELAKADNTNGIPAIGFYLNNIVYRTIKIGNFLANTNAGEFIYLSTTGDFTNTAPTTQGDILQPLGNIDPSNLYIEINVSSSYYEIAAQS